MTPKSDVRALHWWETKFDSIAINLNKWQFYIAKSVIDNMGNETFNVIWQSRGLGPVIDIAWKVDYALNWSAQLPQTGVSVSISGNWQSCAPGQSYDIDSDGFWEPSASPGKQAWLGVGNVGYSYPGVTGIHIVVGVKNSLTGEYDPIYIDPTSLPLNSSASYQPQESVKWWLGGGNLAGSVYSHTQGAVDIKDYSVPAPDTGNYEWWTTFTFATGTWIDTETKPPNVLLVPASRIAEFMPLYRTVIFNIPIEVGLEAPTTAYLKLYLGQWYATVEVNWNNVRDFVIKLGPIRTGVDEKDLLGQYVATGEEDARINQGLKNAQSRKDLPSNASWKIKPASAAAVDEDADEVEDTLQEPTQQITQQMDLNGFDSRKAKKMAGINNPRNGFHSTNPVHQRLSSAQSINAY